MNATVRQEESLDALEDKLLDLSDKLQVLSRVEGDLTGTEADYTARTYEHTKTAEVVKTLLWTHFHRIVRMRRGKRRKNDSNVVSMEDRLRVSRQHCAIASGLKILHPLVRSVVHGLALLSDEEIWLHIRIAREDIERTRNEAVQKGTWKR